MSFSESRSRLHNIGPAAGVSRFEIDHLREQLPTKIEGDFAVEMLVDEIRTAKCWFRFKKPLKCEFYPARDSAINCLEMMDPPPRKVLDWIANCLKCSNCILLVYIQDVLKKPVRKSGSRVRERDVYDAYSTQEEDDLKKVGLIHDAVYQKRSELEHPQIVVEEGKRLIRQRSNRQLADIYEFARDWMKQSLDIMVPRYRKEFPAACAPEDSDSPLQ